MPAPITRWIGTTPARLREQIQNDQSRNMQLRRAAAAVLLLGIVTMAITTLLQIGIVKRLPDPPVRKFDTMKVNSSDEAYSYGGPDSPINIVAHGVNLVLASTGAPDRAWTHPWLFLLAAALELPQTTVGKIPSLPNALRRRGVVSLLYSRRAYPFRYARPRLARSDRSRAAAARQRR